MRTPEFTKLLRLLNNHPEFSAVIDHDCDAEIISYGMSLWKKWEEKEIHNTDDLDRAFLSIEDLNISEKASPRVKEILQMVLDGFSSVEIRNKFSITSQQLSQLKSKYGLTKKVKGVRNAGNTKYSFDHEQLKKDLIKFNSIRKTAEAYGIPEESLRGYMKRNGINFKRKSAAERVTKEQVKEAILKFATKREAARFLSIQGKDFNRVLKKHNLDWEREKHAA